MKILFVGVFDKDNKSTNTSQLISLMRCGHEVVGYNYRSKAQFIGAENRDNHLIDTIKSRNFDLVLFSKCNVISYKVFTESRKYSKTCLWFMDALVNYDKEMRIKTTLVDYFCCDKKNVLIIASELNKNSYQICEGYNEDIDRPHNMEKEYDISFIGQLHSNRSTFINSIKQDVKIINNAYGDKHAIEVSKTLINLNFCTDSGASDRVYKIMAAGGFLLSDDWDGRENHFIDKEHLVIFKDEKDLNEKIEYYLKNKEEAKAIALSGSQAVKKFSRKNWASRIVELYNEV